jgi:hypothetical protein
VTVEEFCDKTEQTIELYEMPIWRRYDLRLSASLARKRGFVYRIEEILLELAPVPVKGYYVKPVGLKVERVKQTRLF